MAGMVNVSQVTHKDPIMWGCVTCHIRKLICLALKPETYVVGFLLAEQKACHEKH